MTTTVDRDVAEPKMLPFDVEIGDVVMAVRLGAIREGSFDNPKYNRWVVTDISKHVFVGKNRYGIKAAFQKKEYQLGWVVRIDKKPVAI